MCSDRYQSKLRCKLSLIPCVQERFLSIHPFYTSTVVLIEVPNLPVDVDSWGRSACSLCYRKSFYIVSKGQLPRPVGPTELRSALVEPADGAACSTYFFWFPKSSDYVINFFYFSWRRQLIFHRHNNMRFSQFHKFVERIS